MLRAGYRTAVRSATKLTPRLGHEIRLISKQQIRSASQIAHPKVPPQIGNEVVKDFSFNHQKDWDLLRASITKFTDNGALKIPLVINGEKSD